MTAAALAPLAIVGFVEIAKLMLQLYFQYMRVAGKSEDEIDALYAVESAKFKASKPEDLVDV